MMVGRLPRLSTMSSRSRLSLAWERYHEMYRSQGGPEQELFEIVWSWWTPCLKSWSEGEL